MGGGGKGGGGGGSSKSNYTPPPEQVQLQTTGWGGMGPTQVPQTFTQQGMPQWMRPGNQAQQPGTVPGQQTNWFGVPWWGMSAANPGQALSQQDLMYQQQAQPPAAQQAESAQRGSPMDILRSAAMMHAMNPGGEVTVYPTAGSHGVSLQKYAYDTIPRGHF